MKKDHGGLGIHNIKDVNLCLLGNWVKRYIKDEGKIWRTIVDNKYINKSPNIFACKPQNPSRFWQGVMWAAQALKFGYRWVVGDGAKIRFWEDTWFGSSPLSVQFWPLYIICNQQCATLAEVWDGSEVKLTFRRTFSDKMMESWYELEQIIRGTTLSVEGDSLIWQYESKGEYTTGSLYSIINFRGMQPVFIPSIWSIIAPPRVQVFLWLLSHNKLMTKDNLAKRGIQKTPECVFCNEQESIFHLFFGCVVAQHVWRAVSVFLACELGTDYLSVAKFWPASKKHSALNSICSCILWSIWKIRNSFVFDNIIWSDMKQVWWLILRTLRKWTILFKEDALGKIEEFCSMSSHILRTPFQLTVG